MLSREARGVLLISAMVVILSTACGGTPVEAVAAGAGGAGTGGEPTSVYSAYPLPTNLPRWVVFKREVSADRCVRITVAMEAGPGIGIQTNPGWTTELVEITGHAGDCAIGADGMPVTPLDQVVQAQSGSGTLTIGCSVNVDATLSFPAADPWVPANDPLDAEIPVPSSSGTGLPVPC
jgi:hypothetical protein